MGSGAMDGGRDTPPTPLLIVTGPPATGKTTLGRRLATDLRLPFLGRDDFKEILFDQLGWGDRAWSRRLGRASWHLLFHALEAELAAGRAALVESNFRGEFDTERFRALRARHHVAPFQINCVTAGDVLLARFTARAASAERHPGHVETENVAEFADDLRRGRYAPLDIGGRAVEVDTTDFAALDYAGLLATARTALADTAPTGADRPLAVRLDRLDHLVLTVRDLAASRDWYARVLGMAPVVFGGGRTALAFGDQKINLHEAGREFAPHAARPTPGSGDLCFVTATPLAAVLAHLDARGVPVEEGPVRRAGARGPLSSVYLRDPDGNLIEIANALPATDDG